MPWIGGAIIGGLGLIGSVYGSKKSQSNQNAANEMNINLNKENRDWQEQMSNTEYQRHVKDLQAAGLNPMLALHTSGSVPTNSAAKVEANDSWSDFGRQASSAAASGVQAATLKANIENIKADTASKMADTALTAEQAKNASFQTQITANSAGQLDVANRKQWEDLNLVRKQIENVIRSTQGMELDQTQKNRLMPLLIQEQQLQNQLKANDVPESEVNAEWYRSTGVAGKAISTGKQLIDALTPIGKGAKALRLIKPRK